jgi:hypothetical protein
MKKTIKLICMTLSALFLCSCASVNTVNNAESAAANGQTNETPDSQPSGTAAESADVPDNTVETTDETGNGTDLEISTPLDYKLTREITEINNIADYFESFLVYGDTGDRLEAIRKTPGTMIRCLEASDYHTPLELLRLYESVGIRNTVIRTRDCDLERDHSSASGNKPPISRLPVTHPIQRLEKIDDDHIVFTYRILYQNHPVFHYLVYERELAVYEDGKEVENWHNWGECYYLYKLLSVNDLSSLEKGKAIPGEILVDLMMVNDFENWSYNECNNFVYSSECDPEYEKRGLEYIYNVSYKAAVMLKEGVAVISSWSEKRLTNEMILTDLEFFPYGQKCEKYPCISILADGFYPPLPE